VFDRVVSMTYTNSNDLDTIIESHQYEYDKNSNITKETNINNYPTQDSEKVNESRAYEYDGLGQLLKFVLTDHNSGAVSETVYTYDKVGNRLTEIEGDKVTRYIYNNLNQLTAITETTDGTVTSQKSYLYDANGNQILVTDTIKNEVITSRYDVENRLTKVMIEKDSQVVLFQENEYNGDGQRIKKTDNGVVTNYYYSGSVLLYMTDGDDNETSRNIIGLEDNIITTVRKNEVSSRNDYYVYTKDIKDSTINIVDSLGSGMVSYEYTDFGETTKKGDTDLFNEICYTGGVYDESTGFYYLNARYYNPEDGRFLTQDTYRGEKDKIGTWHLYAYCANNPINYVDLSGHFVLAFVVGWAVADWVITATVAAVATTAVVVTVKTVKQASSVINWNYITGRRTTLSKSKASAKVKISRPRIARRIRTKSKKDAYERAKRAGKGKEPEHDAHDPRGPHYHPNVNNNQRITPKNPSSHDHYFYPKGK